jgi:CubicO group peptidase (beta-lactamase class C family)
MRFASKWLAVVFAAALAACDAGAANVGDAEKAKVDAIAEAWIKAGHTPGMVVGIAQDGKMLYAKAYGAADLERNIPMAADSILLIGSITKQFTAAAMMQLVEQGKVSLSDPIAKYFPEFPRGNEVTIRHVLNHTSGMFNYTSHDMPDETKWRQDYTTDAMVKRIAGYTPAYDFEPGTAWRYSNSGFFVAGAIIEKVTGEPLRAYLQKNVIEKAGLSADTALDDDEREVLPRRAEGYDPVKDKPGSYIKADFIDMSVPGGAGAMRSTVQDLVTWQHALFTNKVVSAKSVTEMTTPGKLKDGKLSSTNIFRTPGAPPPPARRDPPSTYALGLSVGTTGGHKAITHTGGIQGFNCYVGTFPDDHLTVVVLTNTSSGGGVAREIVDSLLKIESETQP